MVHQVLAAASDMSKQLNIVSRKLEQFYVLRGHFPQTEQERDLFQKALSKYISDNPFHPIVSTIVAPPAIASSVPNGQKSDKPSYTVPLFWLQDADLDESGFQKLAKHPDESWRLLPGTILILTNKTNTYFLCAMGEDGVPMRDLSVAGEPAHVICNTITGIHDGQVDRKVLCAAPADNAKKPH